MEKLKSISQRRIDASFYFNQFIDKSTPYDNAINRPRFLGNRLRMAMLMVFADGLGFMIAGSAFYILNMWVRFFVFQLTDLGYIFIPLICLILFASTKLYPGVGINPAEEIKLVLMNTSIGFLVGMLTFDLKTMGYPNYLAFVPLGFFSICLVLAMRWLVRILTVQAKLWGEPVAVFARGSQIDYLTTYFLQRHRLGFVPRLAVTDSKGKKSITSTMPVMDLHLLLAADPSQPLLKGIDTVLVDASLFGHALSNETYKRLFSKFRHVIFVSSMGWMEGASLSVHDFEGLTGIEARGQLLSPASSTIKRAMDIGGSLLGMFLFAPLMVLIFVMIKLDSPGSVFYKQVRIGKSGKNICIYKFRTMVMNAEQTLESHLKTNAYLHREWSETQKLRNDPRVTRVGKWLRKFSIDEIPQLINVLKGEMSLVGPRPIVASETHHYGDKIEVYKSLRPGLTGLWQVSGRNHTSYKERVQFDVHYARNWSLWLDLYILPRTVWVVLSRDGAY